MIPCLFSPTSPSKSPSVLQRSLLLATNFDFLPVSPMESLALLKFWKTSSAKVGGYEDALPADSTANDANCLVSVVDEEEDSFFELVLSLPDSELKEEKIDRKISDEAQDARINTKPPSPISILKQSAPKLRVFVLRKLIRKSKAEKPQIVSTAPKLNRCDSLGITGRRSSDRNGEREIDASSGRLSKDSVQKYLSLIKKPRFAKIYSTRSSDLKESFDFASTASIESHRKSQDRASGNGRFRTPSNCSYLGKSRSAGQLLVSASSPGAAVRKDDSLAQQNDGIQGAILHCKESLNSWQSQKDADRRVMSRCASDESHNKAMQRSDR